MKLSVIYLHYNGENFLKPCLEPVLGMLTEECECIIVDDGSREKSKKALRQYEGRRNIRLVYHEHGGPSSARNAGLMNASGEYIVFLDGDYTLCDGMVEELLKKTEAGADLCIFGIQRIDIPAKTQECWTLENRLYESSCEFADSYIRNRHLLIYSQSNKLYKRSILTENGIRFNESLCFGEDRLFNYEYLKHCRRIITSDRIMLKYINWSANSLSQKRIDNYFNQALFLHEEKMKCFLSLSKNTDTYERESFRNYDYYKELENVVLYLQTHGNIQSDIAPLNRILFPDDAEGEAPDVLIVLGSGNCGYRVDLALSVLERNSELFFILSGGNLHNSGKLTESVFMKERLLSVGVREDRIITDDLSKSTRENLEGSFRLLREIGLSKAAVGIVTAGFHVLRTKELLRHIKNVPENIRIIPAYGPNTGKDNWYKNDIGFSCVLQELRKLQCSIGRSHD